MTPDQLRTRQRIEGLIRLMSPALDAVLAVGERISRIVEPEDAEYYPPRATRVTDEPRPVAKDAVKREEQAAVGGPLGTPGRDCGVRRRARAPRERAALSSPRTARASSPIPTSCSRSTTSRARTSPRACSPAIGSLILIGVFLYLFRACIARGAAVPQWFIYLFVVVAPILYAIATVLGALDAIDIADEFADGTPDPR